MEPDKNTSFQELEVRQSRKKMYDLPKLNVVRRINFDEKTDGSAKHVARSSRRTSPRRESDRIRFLQNLKQEISNAKVTVRRPITRSLVKKSQKELIDQRIIRSTSLDHRRVNEHQGRPSTSCKVTVESRASVNSSTGKCSLDSNRQLVKLQGTVDNNSSVNNIINPTLEQNETLQFCTVQPEKTPAKSIFKTQLYGDLEDDVDLGDAPFCIDMQEEIDNEPVLQDQEFTDYIHQQFQQMDIGKNIEQINQQIIAEENDSYCSSGDGSIEKGHTQIVEAIVHAHDTTTNCVEQVTHKSMLSVDSSPSTKYEPNVTMLRHSNTLDYLGLLSATNEIAPISHSGSIQTVLIQDTVSTANIADLQTSPIGTSSINYLGSPNNKAIEPESQIFEAVSNNNQPTLELPVIRWEDQGYSKIMKKKDFFNKENKKVYKFPDEKKIKIIETQAIFIDPTNSVKKKEKQRKALSTLQEVKLDNLIDVKNKPKKKKKQSKNVTKTEVCKDIITDNSHNVENSAFRIINDMSKKATKPQDGDTKQTPMTRNRTKQLKLEIEKVKINTKLRKPIPKTSEQTTIKQIKDEEVLITRRKKTKENQFETLNLDNDKISEVSDISPITETNHDDFHVQVEDVNVTASGENSDVLKNPKDYDIIQEDAEINTLKIKKSQRNNHGNKKSYVDFLSDEDDFVWSSSSWAGSSESDADTDMESNRAKKKKKQKKNFSGCNIIPSDVETNLLDLRTKKKRINKSKNRKISRERGDTYISRKGVTIPGKYMKNNPCCSENCFHSCYTISEEKRRSLFHHYWSLCNTRKRDWLVSNAERTSVKRKRVKEFSRRSGTFKYYINEGEGRREVCLKFLEKTLDISQKFIYNTLSVGHLGSSKEDSRGKHSPQNKTPTDVMNCLQLYLKNLPVLPSHYCRKGTSKLYLPAEFRNLSNLYRIYKATQSSEGKPNVGESLFRKFFATNFNYGFHVPRKDKCKQCLKYEHDKSPEMEEIQKRHLDDKEETYKRFKTHQNIHSKDSSILCVSYDLQKVLNTPHGNSILLYYYRKLCVYNLTFYECGTKEGHCYTWSEVEGKRGANEICSILKLYIQDIDNRGTVKHLLLYSDCCPGQNRNKVVISCIRKLLDECNNLESIQLNYLLPGHTYMPVDSMHSVIEKSVKNTNVWTPSQWAMVFSLARKSPKPYHVKVLMHKDFMNWDSIIQKDFQKLLTGKVNKLRTVTFKKSAPEKIFLKYSMHPEAKTETIEVPMTGKKIDLKRAYKSKLPISKKKQDDFIKMCSCAIPEIYHSDYLNLNVSNNVEDNLQETDIEDSVE